MTYRVVRIRTGETYAAYTQRHYHEAIAAALDAAELLAEQFAVYGILGEFMVLYVTPEDATLTRQSLPHYGLQRENEA